MSNCNQYRRGKPEIEDKPAEVNPAAEEDSDDDDDPPQYEVEKILRHGVDREGNPVWKVKWYNDARTTWEPRSSFVGEDTRKMVDDYESEHVNEPFHRLRYALESVPAVSESKEQDSGGDHQDASARQARLMSMMEKMFTVLTEYKQNDHHEENRQSKPLRVTTHASCKKLELQSAKTPRTYPQVVTSPDKEL